MIIELLRHHSTMHCGPIRRSLGLAALIVICLVGCENELLSSKSIPSRWIKISVTAGQETPKAVLTERDFHRIKTTIPKITTAIPERFSNSVISSGNQTKPAIICATNVDMQSLLEEAKCEIVDGRFLSLTDGKNSQHVVVISQSLANRLFPDQSVIDKTVPIGKRDFKVVGVLGEPKSPLVILEMADVYMDLNELLEPAADEPSPDDERNPPSSPLDWNAPVFDPGVMRVRVG